MGFFKNLFSNSEYDEENMTAGDYLENVRKKNSAEWEEIKRQEYWENQQRKEEELNAWVEANMTYENSEEENGAEEKEPHVSAQYEIEKKWEEEMERKHIFWTSYKD